METIYLTNEEIWASMTLTAGWKYRTFGFEIHTSFLILWPTEEESATDPQGCSPKYLEQFYDGVPSIVIGLKFRKSKWLNPCGIRRGARSVGHGTGAMST